MAGVNDEGPPGEGGPEANLTAARFRKGSSGNPGGRPKDLPRFRRACREKGWAWLEQLDALMTAPGTPPAEKLAIWRAVCDRGGYLPADKTLAPELAAPAPPSDAPLPSNVTGAVDLAVRALAAQVAALEQAARTKPLDELEQRRLEAAAQRLADIEASRGRLLIAALQSRELNKDAGRTLTEMFGGRKPPPPPPPIPPSEPAASATETEGERKG